LDELSTGLDITTRNEFKKFIYDYTRKHGMTVVLISHNIDEIVKLCDRLILLKNGVISEDMSIEKYKKNPKELEKFLERKLH
jgi:ABC-type multidrug transport system ATPase subunit